MLHVEIRLLTLRHRRVLDLQFYICKMIDGGSFNTMITR